MSTIKGLWKFRPHVTPMEGQSSFREYVKFKWFPYDWPDKRHVVAVASTTDYYYEDGFSAFDFDSDGSIRCLRKVTKIVTSDTGGIHTSYPNDSYAEYDIKKHTDSNNLCWYNGSISEPMLVDFGEEEQNVTYKFYTWFTNNAVDQTPVECSYNGITSIIDRGHVSTLTCREKYTIDNIKIKGSPLPLWFEYNGQRNHISNGETILLQCAGKRMKSDIVVNTIKEYPEMYTYNLNMAYSETTSLRAEIKCSVGDLVVAAIATRDKFTISNGWTLLSTSAVHSDDTINQTLSWAWKFAESTNESIMVTQASQQLLYINMVALQGATGIVDNGYSYTEGNAYSLTINKPTGIVLWGMSSSLWNSPATTPKDIWKITNNSPIVQAGGKYRGRLGLALDQSEDEMVTIYGSENASKSLIIGCLTVQGMDRLY